MFEIVDFEDGIAYSPYNADKVKVKALIDGHSTTLSSIINEINRRIVSMNSDRKIHPSVGISPFLSENLSVEFLEGFQKCWLLRDIMEEIGIQIQVECIPMGKEESVRKISEFKDSIRVCSGFGD